MISSRDAPVSAPGRGVTALRDHHTYDRKAPAMRTKRPIWPGYATIQEAVQYLASACDGAIKRDGHGFRSDHVAYGHWLAQLPEEEWGSEEHLHGLTIIRVYRQQLRRAGFDPDVILGGGRRHRMTGRQAKRLRAGWAPDRTGQSDRRWWNGVRWTHACSTSTPKQDRFSTIPPPNESSA